MATKTRTRAPKCLSFDAVDRYLMATTATAGFDDVEEDRTRLGCWLVARRVGCLPGKSTPIVPRTVVKWRDEGLDVWQADRIATALGMEPDDARLWGQSWRDAADLAVETFLAESGEPYDPPQSTEQRSLAL